MGGVIIRSALPHLEKFKHMFHGLCTLSSPHLGYAACIEKSKLLFDKPIKKYLDTLYDPIREMKYREMASNIFKDCDHTTVTRVDVNFSISNKSIDSMIGRKAHVSFLSNSGFLTMFTNRFKETLFDQAN